MTKNRKNLQWTDLFILGFEIMENDPPEPTLVLLETDAVSVVGKDWFSRADKVFTSNLGKYRKYRGNSVKDLLRAMRNKVSLPINIPL